MQSPLVVVSSTRFRSSCDASIVGRRLEVSRRTGPGFDSFERFLGPRRSGRARIFKMIILLSFERRYLVEFVQERKALSFSQLKLSYSLWLKREDYQDWMR